MHVGSWLRCMLSCCMITRLSLHPCPRSCQLHSLLWWLSFAVSLCVSVPCEDASHSIPSGPPRALRPPLLAVAEVGVRPPSSVPSLKKKGLSTGGMGDWGRRSKNLLWVNQKNWDSQHMLKQQFSEEAGSDRSGPPSSQAHPPSSRAHQPSSPAHQPSSQAHQPSSQAHQSSSPAPQPSSQARQPSSNFHRPSSQAHRPSNQAHRPSMQAHQPSSSQSLHPLSQHRHHRQRGLAMSLHQSASSHSPSSSNAAGLKQAAANFPFWWTMTNRSWACSAVLLLHCPQRCMAATLGLHPHWRRRCLSRL